jgi:hypothetical protein
MKFNEELQIYTKATTTTKFLMIIKFLIFIMYFKYIQKYKNFTFGCLFSQSMVSNDEIEHETKVVQYFQRGYITTNNSK